MSPRDARPAAMPARMQARHPVRCSTLSALTAERLARFPSILPPGRQFIAASALQHAAETDLAHKKGEFDSPFLFFSVLLLSFMLQYNENSCAGVYRAC